MRALTICQPYAELIARGEKPIENRTWWTAYRGPLAIHAGKSRDWLGDDDERLYPSMPYGAIVALTTLVECLRVGQLPEHLRGSEHANGPYCFVLGRVQRLARPIECRGAQGLWTLDVAMQGEIIAQAETS